MNEQLQQALAELINKANGGIDAASDLLVSELPLVIQELLVWYAVKSGVQAVLGIVGLFIVYKYTVWLKGVVLKGSAISESELGLGIVGAFTSVAVSFASGLALNLTWLQIWIAPKVWLIEYAAKLAN